MIPRANKLLNPVIAALDEHLRTAKGDVTRAWTLLAPYELDFVREEIGNCIASRTYFLQNYYVISPDHGNPTCIYPYLYSQSKVDEIMTEHRLRQGWSKLAVLKYRQAGLTEWSTGVMCHETWFKPGAYTISVAQNPAVAAHIQRKVNYAYDRLPWWLRVERQYHNKGEYLEFNRKDEAQRLADPGMASVFLTTHAMAEGGVAVGRTTRNLHLCLSAANQVIDSDGYLKSISKVSVGELVQSPFGPVQVTAFSKKTAADIYPGAEEGYRITPWCGSAFPIEGTGNHRILCTREIPDADIYAVPRMEEFQDITMKDRVVIDVKPITGNSVLYGSEAEPLPTIRPKGSYGKKTDWAPKQFDHEFGFAVGLYIAEGCHVTDREGYPIRISICLDSDEQHLADRFANAVGIQGRRQNPRGGTRSTVHNFYNTAFVRWFGKNIGVKDSKRIPDWAWRHGRDFLSGIVEGMILGDGHVYPNDNVTTFCSTRPQLTLGIRDAALSLGFGLGGITTRPEGFWYGRNCQQIYTMTFGSTPDNRMRLEYGWKFAPESRRKDRRHWQYSEDGTRVYVGIRKLERVPLDYVYDIEVDHPEHQFSLPCAVSSNSELCWYGNSQIYTSDIEPTMNAEDTNAIAESTGLTSSGVWFNWVTDLLDYPAENDFTLVFIPPYHAKKFSLPCRPGFTLNTEELAIKQRVQEEESYSITNEFFNWRRFRMRNAIKKDGHPYAFYSAFPLTPREAFQSSSLGAFPRHKLDEQDQQYVRRPLWHGEIVFNGLGAAPRLLLEDLRDAPPGFALPRREKENRLWIWEQSRQGAQFYLAADASRGKEGDDYACAAVYRAAGGTQPDVQVAEWHGWIEPTRFAEVLHSLGTYYNKCEIAVEYEREGMIVGDAIVRLEYPNLWRPRRSDIIGSGISKILHFSQTHKSKRAIITTMREALLTNTIIIRSSLLISQMRKFVAISFDDNDQPIGYGGKGDNDDCVIGNCIALYCLRQSMPELRAYTEGDEQDSQGNRSRTARPSGGSIYGIYDEWTRMRGQRANLLEAQDIVKSRPGWFIKEIKVTRVNTMYSVIHHGHGMENEMYRQGESSWNITPGAVSAYSEARVGALYAGADAQPLSLGAGVEEWNRMLTGEVWGDWRD